MIKKILFILIACAILLVVILIVRAKYLEMNRSAKATAILDAVIKKLEKDPDSAKSELKKLCENAELRNTLYEMLKSSGKQEYFPKEYLTQEAFAESDMVFWLSHPNELDKAPDEIELKAKIKKKLSNNSTDVEFYLFRFRVKEPHWASKYGWMAGITGPYAKGEEIKTYSRGTFSELEPYDSKTPDQHVDYFLSKRSSLLVTETNK